MPLYEYRCVKCGSKFEVLRRMSDAEEGVNCPKCGDEKPEKVLSVVCGATHGSGKSAPRVST